MKTLIMTPVDKNSRWKHFNASRDYFTINGKGLYCRYKDEGLFYTCCTSGEPECPIKNEIEVAA